MKCAGHALIFTLVLSAATTAAAAVAPDVLRDVERQPVNLTAIAMFLAVMAIEKIMLVTLSGA